MTTTVYTISDHFAGKAPLEHQLKDEIDDNNSITRTVLDIRRKGNNIYIDFNVAIGNQKSYLDAVIAQHQPDPLPRLTITSTPKTTSSKSKNYKRVLVWSYKGERKVGSIVSVDAVAYMQNGAESYTIEIYDATNQNIVAIGTFTNTSEDNVSLVIDQSKVPDKRSRMEISIKRNGNSSKNVYILGLTFGLK